MTDAKCVTDTGAHMATEVSQEELMEFDAETIRELNDIDDELVAAEMAEAAAKASYTEKKHAAEAKRNELRLYVQERRRDRGKPKQKSLLDFIPKDGEAAPQPTVPEGLFEQFPIDRLKQFGLTDGDVSKLQAGDLKAGGAFPINTLGDLKTFVMPDANNPSFTRGYKDIKGLGEKAVDRISEAETAFWSWWGKGGDVEFAREKGVLVAPHDPEFDGPKAEEVAGEGEQQADAVPSGDVPAADAGGEPGPEQGQPDRSDEGE
jgi:hypothetical protein